MKNYKLCSNVDQIDICPQIVFSLQKNGIYFIWQLIVLNEQYLTITVGYYNAKLIYRELSTFLDECNLEGLINFTDSFLENKISDFPELEPFVCNRLKNKKLLYLFDDELSEAKKKLINILHQEVVKFAS